MGQFLIFLLYNTDKNGTSVSFSYTNVTIVIHWKKNTMFLKLTVI